MRGNPIVKKDLQIGSRSMRLSWGLFIYEAVLAVVLFLALTGIRQEQNNIYGNGNIYSSLIVLFAVVAVVQVCIVVLITPIITSTSICGEKERQTFDIMLTTCMSPLSIVTGKVMSAVIHILFYVVASLPLMSLSFVAGGLSWSCLFYYFLSVILLSVLAGSIGIFCSSVSRKSITAVILSFCIYGVMMGGTFLPVMVKLITDGTIGEACVWLLFNPAVFFEEFFAQMLNGNSVLGSQPFSRGQVGRITYELAQGKRWMFASAFCMVLLALVFVLAAAWNINPMHASPGKRKRKKKQA